MARELPRRNLYYSYVQGKGLDLLTDLKDRVQRIMEDDDLTEDALRWLAPGND